MEYEKFKIHTIILMATKSVLQREIAKESSRNKKGSPQNTQNNQA